VDHARGENGEGETCGEAAFDLLFHGCDGLR